MKNSSIEWTDHTFSPWIGCTKISPACDNCYAAVSTPARAMKIGWGPGQPRHRTAVSTWKQPLAWNKAHDSFFAEHGRRQRVFCASLADVFDNEVDREWRDDLSTLIASTPHLDWLLLTKRIGNAGEMLGEMFLDGPPDNIWIGATIVNQDEAARDIPKLLAVPARVRFLSMEPLLGPVDLARVRARISASRSGITKAVCYPGGEPWVDWVIVGGESGPNARPMHPDWARSLRDQCQATGVPLLFKQHGEWIGVSDLRNLPGGAGPGFGAFDHCAYDQQHEAVRVGKKAAGRLLDGRTWDEVPHG